MAAHRSSALMPALLSVGFVLLTVAWSFSNPPGAAPDEPEHYIRAVSVGRLQPVGQLNAPSPRQPTNALQGAFQRDFNRAVRVPANLAAPNSWFCTAADHQASASCIGRDGPGRPPATQPTYVGSYEVYSYVLPGAATLLGRNPVSALLWARAADMLLALALIVAATWLLWDSSSSTSLAGITMAVTPMVLFTSAVLSTSSVEVTSGICMIAAVIRLSREPTSAPGLLALAVSAFLLVVGRPLGPLWVGGGAILLLVLLGADGRRRLRRAGTVRIVAVVAVLLLGAVLNLGWQMAFMPAAPHSAAQTFSFIGTSIAALPEILGEAIGVFGWDDTLMPRPVYAVWGLALVSLISAALLLGRVRDMRTLEALLLAVVLLTVGISAAAVLPTGFTTQGRYVLPALLAVPLYAGEVLFRNRAKLGAVLGPGIVRVLAVLAALVQISAWYTNAHRYAVGLSGPWWFFGEAEWRPPLGWETWAVVAIGGAACIAACSLVPGSEPIETDG